MTKIVKMDMMQLVRKANKDQEIYEDFEIEMYDQSFKLRLTMPDIFDIIQDQRIAERKAFAKCRAQGLDQYGIDEAAWQKELDAITETDPEKRKKIIETLEKDKPQNLAQQEAKTNARFITVSILLPKIIRYSENNELVCKDEKAQQDLGRYMANNSLILTKITEAWAKIMSKYNEIQETAKNSSKDTMLTNSVSKSNVQDD